jgi:GTP-binding protein
MARPIVAIIGRQNVGKSTLLNKLAGKQLSIVADLPGTTRDRVWVNVIWREKTFDVVDTAGLEFAPQSTVEHSTRQQVETAIAEADVIVFLVDVKDGLIPGDIEIAEKLRQSGKPLVMAANKADNARMETGAVDFYQLGLGEPLVISAHHGRGINTLLDDITDRLPEQGETEPEPESLKLAIVGRPNVGKSTLLNAITGGERAIVDNVPGTTRDAVDTMFRYKDENILLIDTAGIRRPGRVERGVEKYSVLRAMRAIDRADVVLLVLDASEPATAQDLHVAGFIQKAAKGIVLVVNKWDLVAEGGVEDYNRYVKRQFRFLPYAPVIFVSASTGRGVRKILPQALEVYRERGKRLPTSVVNEVVQQAVGAHVLPRVGKRQLKVLYATQTGVNPPTFVFFVNDPELVHFSYRRYLENKLRQAFGFIGNPFQMVFKMRGEA